MLELAGPKEMVLIGVKKKVKAGPRDYSRDPCVEYTQELADLATKISNIPTTFLHDLLSPEAENALVFSDFEEEFVFF